MKKCSSCGKEKENDLFSKNRSRPDGLQTFCKSCTKERASKGREVKFSHKACSKCGAVKSISEFSKSVRDGIRCACKDCSSLAAKSISNSRLEYGSKKCNTCNETLGVDFFHSNPRTKDGLSGKCKKCTSKYNSSRFLLRREDILEKDKLYREKNSDLIKRKYKDRMKDNPSVFRSYNATRYARKKNLQTSSVDFLSIAERLNWRCFYCDVQLSKDAPKEWQMDHMIPLSRGGSHTERNLTLSCSSCNLRKNARTPFEFMNGLTRGSEKIATDYPTNLT